ncbi:MAG: hypothetical protein ACLPR9_04530 [Acidimicrobiales bacterium]
MSTTVTLEDVVSKFRETMYLPDPTPIYVVLATVTANRLPGWPVWLLLIAPPSSGKSGLLDSLMDLRETVAVGTLTVAGLITGRWDEKEKKVKIDGLLHNEIGDEGLLVVSDMSQLLSAPAEQRAGVWSLCREMFYGRVQRHFGGHGYRWTGHLGFTGGATESIYDEDLGLVGDRFVYFQMRRAGEDDDRPTGKMASARRGRQPEIAAEQATLVAKFIDGLDIPSTFPEVSDADDDRIIDLASIGARCRSIIPRDGYSREVKSTPEPERLSRLQDELTQLYAGLSVIGAPPEQSWLTLSQVALSGIKPERREVITFLAEHAGRPGTVSLIAGHCGEATHAATRRHLEELAALRIATVTDRGSRNERWTASDWLIQRWWAVDGERPTETDEDSDAPTPDVSSRPEAAPGAWDRLDASFGELDNHDTKREGPT